MSKILLTGASGFIGKKLLSQLCNIYGDNNVTALSSEKTKHGRYLFHDNYNFNTSFFEENNCGDIEFLIHVGAFTPKTGTEANDIINCNKNIINTEKLVAASLPYLKRLIFISTIDVYGTTSDVIDENTSPNPASLYAMSKLYCEKMIEQWAIIKDCECQIFRIGHVYGPGEERYGKIIPATMAKIIKGERPQIWGTGKEKRSFIYVDDVAKVIVNSLSVEVSSRLVNIASANTISVQDVVKTIVDISGSNIGVEYLPANQQAFDSVFDTKCMKQLLREQETNLRDGLLNEWNYYKAI